MGSRFPVPQVLVWLNNIFNYTKWKTSDRTEFFRAGTFKEEIDGLGSFFGTKVQNFSAIDLSTFIEETEQAKFVLMQCYQEILMEKSRSSSSTSSSSSSAAASNSGFVNSFLRSIDVTVVVQSITGNFMVPEASQPACADAMSKLNLISKFMSSKAASIGCPNWQVLAEIALTITVSTASPERGFSVLKLIVTRLRNRLSQPMTDALMRVKLLGGDQLNEKSIDEIADEWYKAGIRNRRL